MECVIWPLATDGRNCDIAVADNGKGIALCEPSREHDTVRSQMRLEDFLLDRANQNEGIRVALRGQEVRDEAYEATFPRYLSFNALLRPTDSDR